MDMTRIVDDARADADPAGGGGDHRDASLEEQLRAAVRARHLGDTLFEIERHLSTAPDPADVVGLALGLACDALGARCASIERRELGGWVTSHTWGSTLAQAGVFHSDLDSPTLAEMKRTGRTALVTEDASGGQGRCGGAVEDGGAHRVSVPITSRGRVIGALTICFPQDSSPSVEESEFVDRFALMLSIWESNRAVMRRHRRVAEAFQRALIDAPLTLQDLDVGHMYAPATDEEVAGGDFYDIFPMHGGRVGISIGDVAGRGLEAASMTALVRDSIRVCALENLAPEDVLARTNRVLLTFFPPEMFATVFFGVVDTRTGVVAYALGGGPPAMHVDTKGTVTSLGDHGPLLGVLDDVEFQPQTLTLRPGEQLALFTNGLTEARDGDRTLDIAGIANLLRASERRDCRGLAQELYEGAVKFAGGGLKDDVAVLVVGLKN